MAFGDSALKKKIKDTLTVLRGGVAATNTVEFFEGKKRELTLIFVCLYRLSDKKSEAQKLLRDTTGLVPADIAEAKKIENLRAVGSCIVNKPTSYHTFQELSNSINKFESHVKDKEIVDILQKDFTGFKNSLPKKRKSNSDDAAVAGSVRGKMYRPTYHTEANSDGDGRTSYRKGNVFGTTGFGRLGKSKKTKNDDDSSDVSADEESSSGSVEDKLKSVVEKYMIGVGDKTSWISLLNSIKALLDLIRKPSDINALSTNNPDKNKLGELNNDYSELKNKTFIKIDDMGKLAALHCFMMFLFELLENGITWDKNVIDKKKKEILDKINKNKDFEKVLKNSIKTFEFFRISIKVNGKNMIIFVKIGTLVTDVLSGLFELVGDSYYVAFTASHKYGGKNDKKKYKKAANGDIKEDNSGKPLIIGKNEWINVINSDESDGSEKIDCNNKNHLTQIPIWEFGDKGNFKDLGGRVADQKFLLKT